MSLTFQPTLTGHSHLRGLALLRNMSIAGQSIVLILVYRLLDIQLAWIPMVLTIGALTAINVLSWLRLHSNYPVSNFEIFAQLDRKSVV